VDTNIYERLISHGTDFVDSPETREIDEATLTDEPVNDWLSGLRVDDWSPAYFWVLCG
jgi:hypothetical protein